jgi:nitric-oxide synthase
MLLPYPRADPLLDKYGHKEETPRQTLVREALEYQELYHRDKGNTVEVKEARIKEIIAEIEATGTYWQTHDELEHGARVAWR